MESSKPDESTTKLESSTAVTGSTESTDRNEPNPPAQQENMLLNMALNILIPTLILMKGSKEDYLGPTMGLVVALAFPIGYGLYDYAKTRKANLFSIIGIVSVLLTGGLSLLKMPPEYIAIKEAAIPGILGIICLVSIYTRFPLVRTFLYNDKVMNVGKVNMALAQYNNKSAFESVLKNASYMLAGSFFLSSALNYILAKIIVVSPPGSEQYNEELGKMMALSFPVIAVPSAIVMMATLFYIFRNITRLTHLHWEELLHQPPNNKNR